MVVDIEETVLASRHRRLEDDDGWRRHRVMMLAPRDYLGLEACRLEGERRKEGL
jgi:hypothetical protein